MCFTLLHLLSWPSAVFAVKAPAYDSLHIFRAGQAYHYSAVFISPAGDTLSRERITCIASGKPWVAQKTQTAFTVRYHYTPQDSLAFSRYPAPTSTSKTKPKRYSWSKSVTTGAIETSKEVWIHPVRQNQYIHTEVAPFPQVLLDSLLAGGKWTNNTSILLGWGAFNGKVASSYSVEKQEDKQYGRLALPGCWLVHAIGRHNKLGNSYLDFYFHPDYGFPEMQYRLYDGTKISLVLEEVSSPTRSR